MKTLLMKRLGPDPGFLFGLVVASLYAAAVVLAVLLIGGQP